MKRLAIGVLLAFAILPQSGSAQFGGGGFGGGGQGFGGQGFGGAGMMGPRLFSVVTIGGNRVTGTMTDQPVTIESKELGTLKVPSSAIQAIAFGANGDEDLLTTVQNSAIKGKVVLDSIQIQSEFGALTIDRPKIQSVEMTQGSFGMGGMMGGMGGIGGGVSVSPTSVEEPAPAPDAGKPAEAPKNP